jgi:hypothetical protein
MKTFPNQAVEVVIPVSFTSSQELIQAILPAFLNLDVATTKDLYFGNTIPGEHVAKASVWMNSQLTSDEIILLYADNSLTPLGIGVEATVLTNKRVLKVSDDKYTCLNFSDIKKILYSVEINKGVLDTGAKLFSKVGGFFGKNEEVTPIERRPIDEGLQLFATINSHIQQDDDLEFFADEVALDFFNRRIEIIHFLYLLTKDEKFKQQLIDLKVDAKFKGHSDKMLKDYPEEIKLAYLKNLAILIHADGEVNTLEVSNLYERFYELGCSPEIRSEITQCLTEEVNALTFFEEFKALISSYHISHQLTLVHAVLTDFYKIAKSTNVVISDPDLEVIKNYVSLFHISETNRKACEDSVDYLFKLQKGEITPDEFKKKMASVSGTLAAGGIPIVVLSFVGVAGLGAAGITSGLAAMGSLVAFIPAINAMVGGILVVAGIAYGIKAGVDYFSGAEEREIKNKREALIQKILLNQQEKINLLNEDMNLLTERLTNAIVDVEKNSQMIQKIKERLELFQNALKSSKNKLEADQLEAKKLQTA